MVTLINNGVACSSIVVEQESVALFVAKELQEYLFKISRVKLPICSDSNHNSIKIYIGDIQWCNSSTNLDMDTLNLKDDGFILRSVPEGLVMTSNYGRGILYSVYAFLELIGCRWFFPGKYGEYIPSSGTVSFEELNVLENPDFEIRSYTEDTRKEPAEEWKTEMFETIDWCCKNKINTFFIHKYEYPNYEFDGVQEVIHEIKKRGMSYEYGGHGTDHLVEREVFEQKPYLFREKNGERRKDGNFCSSNFEAVNMVVDRIKDLLSKNPDIDILHTWFEDVWDGSWCECNLCKDIHPSMQQMNVINEIAKAVGKENRDIKLDMLLYHDTMEVDNLTCNPEKNIVGFFAPRERCYAHSLNDSNCERNQYYYKKLKKTMNKFKENTYLFEYYADIYLFKKMKIHIPKIIINDLREYKKLGISKVSALMFGRYSWWAYEFNLYAYARASWCTEFDYLQALTEFCEKLYPSTTQKMISFYNDIETASLQILTFCKYKGSLVDYLKNVQPEENDFYLEHIRGIQNSIETFENHFSLLKELMQNSEGNEKIRLERNKSILEITILEEKSLYHYMLGRYMHDKSQLELAINYLNDMKKIIESIPRSIKGIAGEDIFNFTCERQIKFLTELRES